MPSIISPHAALRCAVPCLQNRDRRSGCGRGAQIRKCKANARRARACPPWELTQCSNATAGSLRPGLSWGTASKAEERPGGWPPGPHVFSLSREASQNCTAEAMRPSVPCGHVWTAPHSASGSFSCGVEAALKLAKFGRIGEDFRNAATNPSAARVFPDFFSDFETSASKSGRLWTTRVLEWDCANFFIRVI